MSARSHSRQRARAKRRATENRHERFRRSTDAREEWQRYLAHLRRDRTA